MANKTWHVKFEYEKDNAKLEIISVCDCGKIWSTAKGVLFDNVIYTVNRWTERHKDDKCSTCNGEFKNVVFKCVTCEEISFDSKKMIKCSYCKFLTYDNEGKCFESCFSVDYRVLDRNGDRLYCTKKMCSNCAKKLTPPLCKYCMFEYDYETF
jgi:hypothetical protein